MENTSRNRRRAKGVIIVPIPRIPRVDSKAKRQIAVICAAGAIGVIVLMGLEYIVQTIMDLFNHPQY